MNAPILLFVFKRPEHVRRTVEALQRNTLAAESILYIYSDAARYDEMTENYRRALAAADKRLARVCDRVAEVSCGTVIFHKGDAI